MNRKTNKQIHKEGRVANPDNYPAITIGPLGHNLTDQTFGRLRTLRPVARRPGDGSILWLCSCTFGCFTLASATHLRSGNTTSCGCWMVEYNRTAHTIHGDYDSPTYRSWKAMLERTRRSNHISYPDYGGRGVHVCTRWYSYKNFLADMGPRPGCVSDGLPIEEDNKS